MSKDSFDTHNKSISNDETFSFDKRRGILEDLQRNTKELEAQLETRSGDSSGHKTDLSDVKADMGKMLRIIHALDKQNNQTKCEVDNLKRVVKTIDDDVSAAESDASSAVSTQSIDSSMSESETANSNISSVQCTQSVTDTTSASCMEASVCESHSVASESSCSYDEFHKFKSEVMHMLTDLAKQVNEQMAMMANIMSTIGGPSRKPITQHSHSRRH